MKGLEKVKADFLELNLLLDQGLRDILKKIPHEIIDSFGNRISESETHKLDSATYALSPHGVQDLIKIRTNKACETFLPAIATDSLKNAIKAISERAEFEHREILAKDLEMILTISEKDSLSFEKQILHFLKIARAHLLVEECSIFGLSDGFTLQGIAGLGKQNWKEQLLPVAGVAASTQRAYWSDTPAGDPNFSEKSASGLPRNFLCFPLSHGNVVIGVLNLANRVGGGFSDADQDVIERFALLATHLLHKQFVQKRMEGFAKTSDHLGKYLSSKVVRSVKTKDSLELGGVEKKVVCLFADIRSFTTITEGISAPVLVKLLNFFFERMSAIIDKHEGTLDKIVGDMIMVVWNIPNDQPNPELLAMKAAIEMQKEMLKTVQLEWAKEGIPKVGMGIGVNSGPAVAGNLGSSRFMNYTVVGDTINTAQRIQSKAGAGEIWMAEEMFEAVTGKVERPIRKECDIKMKGKEQTINAYVFKPLDYTRY